VNLRALIAPVLIVGAFVSARVNAQQVVLHDAGPGPVGHYLREALSAPHVLVPPGTTPVLLKRDSAYSQTVIVLRRDAILEGRVHGDVIVVGGDAFLHPGAVIDGRVVAIGGATYQSRLAIVRGGVQSHRDFTFELEGTATGYALDYRVLRANPSPLFSLPGIYGIRIPTYDRVDGLSIPVGPTITLDTGYYEINPIVTYRSNLGAFDPAADGQFSFGRVTRITLFVGRSTFTNDAWIWSDLINSAAVLGVGIDTRNYYRADRAEAALHRVVDVGNIELEPFVGIRGERDRSVGPDSFTTKGPWSFFDRNSRSRMLRPNPTVLRGDVRSILVGSTLSWEAQRVRAALDLTSEASEFEVRARRFVQSTLNGAIIFPTFGAQEFRLSTHVVQTFGDTAPPQRWSYLGGSGTIITLPLMSLGGDRLLYFESNYYIPIQRFDLPVLGAPSVTLRHMIGSAGVATLPPFEQNLGLRFALSFARFDAVVDPARRAWEFNFGLAMAR
jgi:hypothetical protein